MKYTQVRADTFQTLQMNAGILVDSFNPETGEIGNILGATTGGLQFQSNPEYVDYGEDVDNVPPNTWQLKQIKSFDPAISGTFLTVTAARAADMVGPADVAGNHVTPRNYLKASDFKDVWAIGDYSDKNTGADAGYLALHLLNVLNTAGIQWQTTKDGKGQFAFEYHAHYDLANIDNVPFDIWVKSGDAALIPVILLDEHYVELTEGDTHEMHGERTPADATITWTSSDTSVATVASGTITAVAEGNCIITAAITVDGVTVNDTCTVVVAAAE